DFGSILAGYQASYTNLTIGTIPNGLPRYSWFRWEPGTTGTFSANLTVDSGQGLEIHLWTMQGGNLTELSRAAATSRTGDKGSASGGCTAGAAIFVEMKGINIAPGVLTEGLYEIGFTFG